MKNRLLSLSTSLVLLSLVACGDNANDDTTEEDPLTICERVTDCSGHGTCITVDTVITCDCDEGYEVDGLDCVLPEDSGFELQIDAGSFTLGLNEARNFDVDGGSNGVIWGTFTGTGQPVCFVVDGDADFKMTVGRATKWNEPDIEGSDTGSFDDYECSQNSTAHEPDFCWLRTQQDISYVIQAYRFGYPETVSRATIAVVDGPCPAEVDEAVFTYDEEVSGSPVFENHQVAAITLNEGFANLATESFDAEGTDVLSGFSATFTSPGGPVCFAMDADIDGKITVAKKSDLDDNPFPDSANVGAVPSAQVECYDDGSGSEPDFCGLADTTAGTEYIIFGESLSNYAPKMKASLVAISGPCPLSIDEAVFVYDGEISGGNVFENHQVVEAVIAGLGETNAIKETLDPEGIFEGGTVKGGISATYTATTTGSVCFVTDCDLDCKIAVGEDSALIEDPSPISVGDFDTNLCYGNASGELPDLCTLRVTSGTTYRILGESYSNRTASRVKMAVAVFEGDCSDITESSLLYDDI